MYRSVISTYLVWRRHFGTEKKILSSCAGYCTAKKHILVFSEVNKFNLFPIKFSEILYLFHPHQPDWKTANRQQLLSEVTDDHTCLSHVFCHTMWRKGSLVQFHTVCTKWTTKKQQFLSKPEMWNPSIVFKKWEYVCTE